jgi:hypothetical protein
MLSIILVFRTFHKRAVRTKLDINVLIIVIMNLSLSSLGKFDDTKGVTRSPKSKKDRLYNGYKKKDRLYNG